MPALRSPKRETLPPFRDAGQVFLAGEVAFRIGAARAACPYRPDSRESVAWLAGWDAAQEEAADCDAPLPNPPDRV